MAFARLTAVVGLHRSTRCGRGNNEAADGVQLCFGHSGSKPIMVVTVPRAFHSHRQQALRLLNARIRRCNKCSEPALNTTVANEPEEYHGEEICKERLEGCRERDAQVQTRHCEEREGRQRRKGEESETGDRDRLVQGAPQRQARAAAVGQSQNFEFVEFAFALFEHPQAAQLEVVTRGRPRVRPLSPKHS